jgi:hypothetical protein
MQPRFRRTTNRDRRRARPVLQGLERRELLANSVGQLAATPQVLSPPNGRIVSVVVTGIVFETKPKISPQVQYTVFDEYRRINLSGPVPLTRVNEKLYNFKFVIKLQASRANSDLNGRQYNLIVGTSDPDNSQGEQLTVLVPHNALRPGQTILPYPIAHPVKSGKKLPPVNPPTQTSPLQGSIPFLGKLLGGLTGGGASKK